MRENINPVRKIGPGQNSLRGQVQSKKNDRALDFESALERDYLSLLEYDPTVLRYVEQPVEIIYNYRGLERTYTPDVLVFYDTKIKDIEISEPILVEIKYRDKLKDDWEVFKPKFKAAKEFAKSKGWKFLILTEKEIRTVYLENVKFLLPYRDTDQVSSADSAILFDCIKKLDITTPQEIIAASARDKYKQAELLFCLWHLIATKFIGADLSKPLTMNTEIWAK